MKYTKPEVVLAGSAFLTIQGLGAKGIVYQDVAPPLPSGLNSSASAYESDE
jgi:hypothetical protein